MNYCYFIHVTSYEEQASKVEEVADKMPPDQRNAEGYAENRCSGIHPGSARAVMLI